MAEERRLVTIVFADVVGSTSLGERLDPEDMRLLLGRFYEIARDVVADHGGILEKFIGDAALAIFGAPRAHDDDPRRALAAALELRDRVRADVDLGTQLPIRIGVNTGEVIAAASGADPSGGDFIVTGDAVNVAARLQQSAEPWAVLVGERTVAAAGTAFRFGAPMAVEAKGKQDRLRAHLLLGRGSGDGRRRTPLFGRESELEQLELAARRAIAEHRPFLITVLAPPGIGKSRLLEAFLGRLPTDAPDARYAVARCLPYGQRLTYWPLRALLGGLMGVSGDSVPETRAIAAWLSEIGCPEPERTGELLSATLGATDLDARDPQDVFEAWREAIAAAARRAPLVLVFEDLHWASDSLLALVEFVMQPRARAGVLTIVLARPELLDRRPQWGAGRLNALNTSLEPLPAPAMRELVASLLEDPAPGLLDQIIARAEGNPFFAGEMVRSVLERSREGTGDSRRTRSVELLSELPDTVQATVLSRLDLLEPGDRHLLQVGAVLGRAFRAEEITALTPPRSLEEVREGLERCIDRDLIELADGDSYTFRHVLIRDGAYQTLPRGERGRLHAAAAALLERAAAGHEDADAELVAYHYREAARAPTRLVAERAPNDALRAKAVEWLSRAADMAIGVAASIEASAHLRAALDLADPPDQVDLLERLGDVHLDEEGAADAYRRALDLAEEQQLPADRRLTLIAQLLLVYTRSTGGLGAATRQQVPGLVDRGQSLLDAAHDEAAIARFRIALGFVPFSVQHGETVSAADAASASAAARLGLEVAERLGDPNLISPALDALASVAVTQSRWEEVRQLGERRMALDRLAPIEVVDAHATAAWAASALGDARGAEEITAAGLARIRPRQAPTFVLHLLVWRIYALVVLGRWDEAIEIGDRAHEAWDAIGRGRQHFAGRGFLAALDVARGRRDTRRIEALRATLTTIYDDDPAMLSVVRAYVDLEPTVLHAFLAPHRDGGSGGLSAEELLWHPELFERILGVCGDHHLLPGVDLLDEIIAIAVDRHLGLAELQARRALALATEDRRGLAEAVGRSEAAGFDPLAARLRCELGQLSGDETALARGMHELERIGDIDQLERVRNRHGAIR